MKKLLTYFLVGAVVFTFSCKDDEVDCAGNEGKILSYVSDYSDAYDNADCAELEEISGKIISLIRKSKSCGFIKDAIEDGDYADVEDLIDDYQSDVEDDKTTLGC